MLSETAEGEASDSCSSEGSYANSSEQNVLSSSVDFNGSDNLTLLYEKYTKQCDEMERLEKQSSECKSLLSKVVQEKEDIELTFKNYRSENIAKLEELERKLLESDYQLKAAKDRSAARDAHYTKHLNEVTSKTNDALSQLRKKMEQAEKEKNNAVIRYAVGEAEILRLKSENEQYENQMKLLTKEIKLMKDSAEHNRLECLEVALSKASQQQEHEKKLRQELEDKLAFANKRIETNQITVNELKLAADKLQKQLSNEISEKNAVKDDHKKLILQMRSMELQNVEAAESMKKSNDSKEELYKNVLEELSRLRDENSELSKSLEILKNENQRLEGEYEKINDELKQAKDCQQEDLAKLRQLESVQLLVDSSKKSAERAEKLVAEAILEKEQAEEEAETCRREAERMLEITQQLSEKNCVLTSDCECFRLKASEAEEKIIDLQGTLNRISNKCDEAKNQYDLFEASSQAEISLLKATLDEKILKVQELSRLLDEARNEKEIIKKKNNSALKELRSELLYLRKTQFVSTSAAKETSCSEQTIQVPSYRTNGENCSSRASSISSVDVSGKVLTNTSSVVDFDQQSSTNIQQQMIEKIIKIQRQLARKQDKIDFLEEHIRQCTEELCKKTKIIQNYALREEASLLIPESDLTRVSLTKRAGGMSLLGTIFTGDDKKSELELATEVNSRLQAVLEDALYKNITLKNNLDTLGEEISRLSRENRQLSLASS